MLNEVAKGIQHYFLHQRTKEKLNRRHSAGWPNVFNIVEFNNVERCSMETLHSSSGAETTLHDTETKGAFHLTKMSGNFGPKLNGSVRSNRKIFGIEGPPFEVDPFFSVGPV